MLSLYAYVYTYTNVYQADQKAAKAILLEASRRVPYYNYATSKYRTRKYFLTYAYTSNYTYYSLDYRYTNDYYSNTNIQEANKV